MNRSRETKREIAREAIRVLRQENGVIAFGSGGDNSIHYKRSYRLAPGETILRGQCPNETIP